MSPKNSTYSTMMMAFMLGAFSSGCAMQTPAAAPVSSAGAAMQAAEMPADVAAIAQTTDLDVKGAKGAVYYPPTPPVYTPSPYPDQSQKSMKSAKSQKSMKSAKSQKSIKSAKSQKSMKSASSKKDVYNPYPDQSQKSVSQKSNKSQSMKSMKSMSQKSDKSQKSASSKKDVYPTPYPSSTPYGY